MSGWRQAGWPVTQPCSAAPLPGMSPASGQAHTSLPQPTPTADIREPSNGLLARRALAKVLTQGQRTPVPQPAQCLIPRHTDLGQLLGNPGPSLKPPPGTSGEGASKVPGAFEPVFGLERRAVPLQQRGCWALGLRKKLSEARKGAGQAEAPLLPPPSPGLQTKP